MNTVEHWSYNKPVCYIPTCGFRGTDDLHHLQAHTKFKRLVTEHNHVFHCNRC